LDWVRGSPPGAEAPGGGCDRDLSRFFATEPPVTGQSK
ncbi:TetR family transcriptional regulator, partial [Streptomyces pharetrae]